MCKATIDQLGMTKWPGVTQFIKYQGIWVRLNPNWGFPSAPKIENQRLENGKYIQDVTTAMKAADAYGDYCKGFFKNDEGYILQSAGGENPKPSWTEFSSELLNLNNTQNAAREGFGGYSADPQNNKSLDKNPQTIATWGKMYSIDKGTPGITAKEYSNPTFPIAKMNKAMQQTCPKGMQNLGNACEINNTDVKKQIKHEYTGSKGVGIGWTGSSFGCNLPAGDNPYELDCEDLPNKAFTCWHVGSIPKDKAACNAIKGSNFASCFASGGRPRDMECPEPAKMIVWVGRPGNSYFATKDDLLSVLQSVATEFPDVRLTNQSEMNDIIAKNLAMCACGWYRTDSSTTYTWRNGDANGTAGFYHIPLTIGYPSNTDSVSGCGGGAQRMIGCPTSPNSWNKGKGGVYLTFSGTLEFAEQKLTGLNFSPTVVESHQQLITPAPPPKKMVWGLGAQGGSGNKKIYSTEKPLNTRTTSWNNVPGGLTQLSTGQKEVYGVSVSDNIYAHSKNPNELNATGTHGWRQIPGGLTNISASNKDWIFGVNRNHDIYQCKKPCKGAWQKLNGKGIGEINVAWGGNHMMNNCNQYTTTVGPYKSSDGQYLANACQTGYNDGTCEGRFEGSSSVRSWERTACNTGVELANAGGGLTQISGGQNYVYGINKAGNLMRARIPITTPKNPQWAEVNSPSGKLQWVNASNTDYLYATNNNDDIFVCPKPCTGGWKQISGGLVNIAADKNNVIGRNSEYGTYMKPMDGMSAVGNWDEFDWGTTPGGQGASQISPEPFVGGMMREGYAPLEGDMITACKDSGTQGGQDIAGLQPTGDFLVKNRAKEKEAAASLQSMQKQVKQSINMLQADNLKVDSAYKNQSLNLLKKLASYENAKHKLLKSGGELDTLSAIKKDSLLRKNSVSMSYYLWLTLAISVLGFTITKIK